MLAGLTRTGRAMLAQVVSSEVVRLPGLGPMLLPGPHGFVHADDSQLNPSSVRCGCTALSPPNLPVRGRRCARTRSG